MKKLNRLQINSGKIMRNEELLTLRGGYDAGCVSACTSNSDCTNPDCPHCEYAAGNPDQKFCFNP
jgi:hypothetical protein